MTLQLLVFQIYNLRKEYFLLLHLYDRTSEFHQYVFLHWQDHWKPCHKNTNHIHISPGISNKITDIIDILKQLGYQFKVKINEPRSYDVHHFVGDKTKRIMIFGDEKFIDLKEGIEKLIEIYKKTDKDLLL